MLKLTGSEDYYPTPERFLEVITEGLDWHGLKYVLEPSAGKGNIADYLKQARKRAIYSERYGDYEAENRYELDIDCIELEPELRVILKDKGYRVVQDDFMTYHTYKHYDLIIMNPPFSQGARHLLKAIEVQSLSGGGIICILNAETLRNPYTNERKELAQRLVEYGAEIKYYEKAFSVAENPTNVEVAVVKLTVPEGEPETTIFDNLREKEYEEYQAKAETGELAELDLVKSFVALYNRELEWGLRLYREYREMQRHAMDKKSLLRVKIGDDSGYGNTEEFSVNRYVRAIRRKYWEKLFKQPIFTEQLTSNLYNKYTSKIQELAGYDFSYWNIKTIQQEIALSLVKSVEQSIIDLFDKLSHQYAWDSDLNNGNIHYYNGWKTNLSWKINRRVILPLQAWDYRGNLEYSGNMQYCVGTLSDIEKVLNYLDNGETRSGLELGRSLEEARKSGYMRNIRTKYFEVTFYKKGTCHITFRNERLLKKLNIFGSQRKGWLPKGYARRRYEELDAEEQAVIESFEGRESYSDTLMESKYYLFEGVQAMPMLAEGV
jgi:hypothetical protein